MGKGKKDKKAKKASSAGGDAGALKLPKPLRKAGKAALKAASNPAVSETVAAALLGAAAALREGKGVREGAKAAGVAATDAVDQATRDMSGIASTLRALALDVARKTIDAWAADGGDEDAPRGQAKPAKAAKGKSKGKAPAAAGDAKPKPKALAPGKKRAQPKG
jgi:hypothetical protein